jgi:hypothetical protein
VSDVYTLGRFFAYARILLLEGVYATLQQNQPPSGETLRSGFDDIDKLMDDLNPKDPQKAFRCVTRKSELNWLNSRRRILDGPQCSLLLQRSRKEYTIRCG